MQKKKADLFMSSEMQFGEHKSKAFELALGQCMDAFKNKLEATAGHETAEDVDNVMKSLKCIKNAVHKVEGDKCLQGLLHDACLAFCLMEQQKNKSNTSSCERFANTVEAIKNYGGKFGTDAASVTDDKHVKHKVLQRRLIQLTQ